MKTVLTYILSTDQLARNTQMGPSIKSSSLTVSGGKTTNKKNPSPTKQKGREGRRREGREGENNTHSEESPVADCSFPRAIISHVFQAATSQHVECHQGKQG